MSFGREYLSRSWLVFAVFFAASLILPALARAQASGFDLAGQPFDPLAASSGKVAVLVFVRSDCPISSRYAPVIQQISAKYEQDAIFWLVFPDKAESSQTLRKYLGDYSYRLTALRDPGHALVKMSHAEITPEVAVFDRSHHLIYHGRIDDRYVDVARLRPAPTTHELDDAIQSALGGKRLTTDAVKGVGCYISDVE